MATRHGEDLPPRAQREHLARQIRHQLGLLLAPLLAILAAQDVIVAVAPPDVVVKHSWLIHGTLLLGMPLWLRRMWRTSSLPIGPLRTRLLDTARTVRLRMRKLLVWSTDHQVANAAVVGFVPRLRYVYLSDRLLSLMDEDELEAVLLHEAAHVRRRHLLPRLLMLILPLAAWCAASTRWPQMQPLLSGFFASRGISLKWQASLILPLAAAFYAAAAMGIVARLLEHDADLWAAQRQPGQGHAMISALNKLAPLTPDSDLASWMHPSPSRRISFLRQAVAAPLWAAQFQRRLAAAGNALVLLVASLVAVGVVSRM